MSTPSPPQHGLLVRPNDKRKPLQEGQHRTLAHTRVRITGVHDTTLGALDRDDARLLGHRTLTAWKVHWLLTKDEKWSEKQPRTLDEQLRRFATRWAHVDVQLVRYVQVDAPRLLARGGQGDIDRTGNADYTVNPSRCFDREAGATVDTATQERYSKDALAFCIGRQINRQKEAEAERTRKRAITHPAPWWEAA